MSWIFSNSVSKSSAYSNTSVTTNVMNIQHQCVKQLRLQQQQCHYKCHEYSTPVCQEAPTTAAPVSLQMSWIFNASVSRSSAYSSTSVTTNVMNTQHQRVKKLRLQQRCLSVRWICNTSTMGKSHYNSTNVVIDVMNIQRQCVKKLHPRQHQFARITTQISCVISMWY